MAVLNEDFPKIRNTDAHDLSNLINHVLLLLNITKPNTREDIQKMDMQMLLVGDLIRTKFGTLTIPEIKEAFKMYVAREFSDVKVFRVFDPIMVAEVLNAFIEYRNAMLAQYTDKKKAIAEKVEISDERKRAIILEGILNCYDTFLETKRVEDDRYRVFNHLMEMSLLPPYDQSPKVSDAYVQKFNLATAELKKEIAIKKFQEKDVQKKNQFVEQYKKIAAGGDVSVQHRFKVLVLQGFFGLVKSREELYDKLTENINKVEV